MASYTHSFGGFGLRERRVLVEGKGRKERYMYIGAATSKAMGRYKMLRDSLEPWTDDWWVDAQGKPMGDNWLYLMLKRLSDRAGIPGLHPHQFRHTFSINMIEADVPLPTLEVMGGWSRIPQTYLATLGDRAARQPTEEYRRRTAWRQRDEGHVGPGQHLTP